MTSNYVVFEKTLSNNRYPAPRKSILQLFSQWHERTRQRRQLASLDDRALRDIGIDRASAHFEASKPFWRD